MNEHHSIIVIGAGLSGLYTAWRLHQQQQDVIVLEARNRIGGRVLSRQVNKSDQCFVDLGPAWVWPQLQPKLEQLMTELDVKQFKQFTSGNILYEMAPNNIQRYSGQSAHEQSYRIVDGGQRLIEALRSRLPNSLLHLDSQVTSINQKPSEIEIARNGKSIKYSTDKIILALPPRVALSMIKFKPVLQDNIIQLWNSISTWMAGQCKVVFIYKNPFWRNQNLSGEVFSQYGPLTEIYDASAEDESFFALTSFVGINAVQRKLLSTEQLIEKCMAQLQRLFGDESKDIIDIQVKDWSEDVYTSTDIDLHSKAAHPDYPASMQAAIWNNQLILAGTEVAQEHAGYLEGAIVSADTALSTLGFDDMAINQDSDVNR